MYVLTLQYGVSIIRDISELSNLYTGEIFEEKGVLLPQDFPDHTYENCIERKLRIDLYFS